MSGTISQINAGALEVVLVPEITLIQYKATIAAAGQASDAASGALQAKTDAQAAAQSTNADKQAVQAIAASIKQGKRSPRMVSNRCDAGQPSLSSGSSALYSYRYCYTALAGCTALQLVFTNTQITGGGGEILPADTVEVKAAIEAPDGSIFPCYFGGLRLVTIAPGASAVSDPVPVRININTRFAVRVRPKVDAVGKKWPTGGAALAGTAYNGGGGGAVDIVDTGAVSAFNGGPGLLGFQPSAILGLQPGAARLTALLHGSSTVYGSVDTSSADGDYGYLARTAAACNVPYSRLAISGWTLNGMLGSTAADTMARTMYHRAMVGLTAPDFVLTQLSPNDVTGGASFEVVQGRLMRYWDFWYGLGLPVIEATWHPKVSGTYTTLAGQIPDASDPVRRQLNAWKKTLPHPAIVGVLDEASIVEAPSEPSKYRVDGGAWSADGTHLSALGHEQVTIALTPVLAALLPQVAARLAA